MPYYVVQKVTDVLNKSGKSITGAKVLVLGAAYKKDVDDIRESPAVKIITLLQDKGADISYHDPYIPVIRGMRKYPELVMEGVELTEGELKAADCLLLITDHSCFDYGWILEHSGLVVDTRNGFGGWASDKIVKA